MIHPPSRYVDRVFIHCSASDHAHHDDVKVMRKWHLARGWSDVGYHFFIKKDGTLQEGRPLRRVPAAQGGHNSGTIAICLHGLDKDKFTCEQFKTLNKLCDDIKKVIPVTFHGHTEVSAKTCPVFDYKKVLNLNNKGEKQ